TGRAGSRSCAAPCEPRGDARGGAAGAQRDRAAAEFLQAHRRGGDAERPGEAAAGQDWRRDDREARDPLLEVLREAAPPCAGDLALERGARARGACGEALERRRGPRDLARAEGELELAARR